jgi:hypothetical protein
MEYLQLEILISNLKIIPCKYFINNEFIIIFNKVFIVINKFPLYNNLYKTIKLNSYYFPSVPDFNFYIKSIN